jgi:hypothetical protein
MSLIDDFLESTEPGGSSTLAHYGDQNGLGGGSFANDYSNDNMVRVSIPERPSAMPSQVPACSAVSLVEHLY